MIVLINCAFAELILHLHFLLKCSLCLSERQIVMVKICDTEVSLSNEKKHSFCHTLLVDSGKLNYPKNLLNATI